MKKACGLLLLAAVGLNPGCAAGPQVKHVVLFKFKESATPQQVEAISAAFAALPDEIPGIVHFEMGTNSSPEGLNKGLTHAYLLTFENAAARDAYLPHPAHKAFGQKLGPVLDDVCVVDFTVD